ncbi:MAG: ankyrin repeat domain-containing protein [Saprospiraceae bacterium]|nr:ankyrin repeat domain-containing protein [Saprospiraceae bacterium]
MDYFQKLINDIETHSADGIRDCFENGISPNDVFKNKPLIYELITEYGRGPSFSECFKVFVDYGLLFEDKVLLSVFLNNPDMLNALLSNNKDAISNTYSFDCAFTPLHEASLLHISAEYNHLACAKVLVSHGMDVDIKAGVDENGFGGQTPIFHTVNQHANKCIDMMEYLISKSANLDITVKGLIWGKGYQWETFISSVNPLSYAMMGLLPQFHRQEVLIYEGVSKLLKARYGIDYFPANIPNKYVSS